MLELDKTEQTITPTYKRTQSKRRKRLNNAVIKIIKQKRRQDPYVVMSGGGWHATHSRHCGIDFLFDCVKHIKTARKGGQNIPKKLIF